MDSEDDEVASFFANYVLLFGYDFIILLYSIYVIWMKVVSLMPEIFSDELRSRQRIRKFLHYSSSAWQKLKIV